MTVDKITTVGVYRGKLLLLLLLLLLLAVWPACLVRLVVAMTTEKMLHTEFSGMASKR